MEIDDKSRFADADLILLTDGINSRFREKYDAVAIAPAFAEAGVDLVDVSTGQTVRDAQPVYGRMFQTPFSDQVGKGARVATMCVGNITAADQANTILAAGQADLVALGRLHLLDPFFTMKAGAW